MGASDEQDLIIYLVFLQTQKHLNVACLAVWVYELISSFRLEVLLIWRAPWNIPKVLYLCTRYVPLVVLVLLNYYNEHDCVAYQKILAWGVNVSMCLTEIIFALRTWAVWDRNRIMAWFLSIFFLVIWVSSFVIVGIWTGRPRPDATQDPTLAPCGFYYSDEEQRFFRLLNFTFILVFYGVTLCLTCFKAYQYFSGQLSIALMRIIHFDGILYYLFLFAVSLKIFIMNFVAKNHIIAYSGLLSGLQFTFCTLMACKMLLHLRSSCRQTVLLGSQGYLAGFTMHNDSLVFRHTDMYDEAPEENVDSDKLPSFTTKL